MIAASLHHLEIPLRRPFGHVIATRHHAEAIVLVVETEDAVGVGECVPRPYVTGESFTLTDLDLAAMLGWGLMVAKVDVSPYANVQAWLGRIQERPIARSILAEG